MKAPIRNILVSSTISLMIMSGSSAFATSFLPADPGSGVSVSAHEDDTNTQDDSWGDQIESICEFVYQSDKRRQ